MSLTCRGAGPQLPYWCRLRSIQTSTHSRFRIRPAPHFQVRPGAAVTNSLMTLSRAASRPFCASLDGDVEIGASRGGMSVNVKHARNALFPYPPGVAGSAGGLARVCTHKPIAKCSLGCAARSPLLGVKRTWRGLVSMSADDPKRHSSTLPL